MGKDTKIVHFQMIGGTQQDLANLGLALNKLKDKIGMDIEFIITDDKIELHSVKYLINHLYKIYKDMKKLKEAKQK